MSTLKAYPCLEGASNKEVALVAKYHGLDLGGGVALRAAEALAHLLKLVTRPTTHAAVL